MDEQPPARHDSANPAALNNPARRVAEAQNPAKNEITEVMKVVAPFSSMLDE